MRNAGTIETTSTTNAASSAKIPPASDDIRHIPGEDGLPWFGHAREFLKDPRALSRRMRETYGPVFRTRFLGQRTVSLAGVGRLADIGGGSGAFLAEVAQAYPEMALTLFDLPAVVPSARERLQRLGLEARIDVVGGSFRDDPLPEGMDAISLVRVLYDHDDDSVAALLAKVHDALPPGGRLVISEPMSGGETPDPVTDVYFAFYTLAMRTGRTRSAATIRELCEAAGFADVKAHPPRRSFVTSVVTGVRSG